MIVLLFPLFVQASLPLLSFASEIFMLTIAVHNVCHFRIELCSRICHACPVSLANLIDLVLEALLEA